MSSKRATVKGKEIRQVEIEVSELEVIKLARGLPSSTLAEILKDKILRGFFEAIKPKELKDREVFIRDKTLYEVNQSWDYHNNVGIDGPLRKLTESELQVYYRLLNIPDQIIF